MLRSDEGLPGAIRGKSMTHLRPPSGVTALAASYLDGRNVDPNGHFVSGQDYGVPRAHLAGEP